MYVKFIKDWPCVSGPSFDEKKGKHFPKGWEGDLSVANARTAIKANYATDKKTASVADKKVETASVKPKSEKR